MNLDGITSKETLEQLWRTGRYRGKATLSLAMSHHTAEALKAMAVRAALGNPGAMDQLLRFVRDAHDILQPAKDEAKDGDTEPIRPVFRRAPTSSAPSPSADAPAAEPPPSAAPLTIDGKEYE